MRRLIGKFVAAGLLASAVAVAAANPSSAVPRDVCMDEANWWAMMSAYTDHASSAFDVFEAWDNTEPTVSNGDQFYYVHLPDGSIKTAVGTIEYNIGRNTAYHAWTAASDAAISFYDNMNICP